MVEVEPAETLMEIREEFMVSPKGGKPTSKTSYFIKPMLKKFEKTPELPSIPLPFRPVLQVCTFNGWRAPTREWVSWVDHLHSSYKSIWKKAGVYESILSSRYEVIRNEELVLGLAERWCSQTNTFVFSWGEATVSLEDVMVLGGFSVLGNSVSGFDNDKNVAGIEKQLLSVYNNLGRGSSSTGVGQDLWMKRFMKSGSNIEHEAFLSLWLSRFVLPSFPYDSILPRFFKVAVCLSMGIEIALAPVVLASIYKDLTLLKSAMLNVDNVDDFGGDDLLMVTLWAPLQWVQVWAWERLPGFRPKPGKVVFGEPRLARWHNVNKHEIGNVRPLLQSAGENFEWRPYCKRVDNLPFPGFCKGEERWVFLGSDLGKDVETMAHCLRVAELVGIESIEQYNPHRVAMQFGFDQDLPRIVKRDLMDSGLPQQELEQLAWLGYAHPIRDQLLYLPSISYAPQVTVRYLKWLREGSLTRRTALECVATRKRDSIRSKRLKPPRLLFDNIEADPPLRRRPRRVIGLDDTDEESDLELDCGFNGFAHDSNAPSGFVPTSMNIDLDVPPGFPPKLSVAKKADVPHDFGLKKDVGHVLAVPPGFESKCNVAMKLEDGREEGSVFESVVKVARECMESIGDGQVSLKSTSLGKHLEVPPGFVRKNIDPDVPPGFQPKFSVSRNVVDVPPDFVPQGIDNEQLVPPGFQAKLVKVKEECSGKSNQTLLKSGYLTANNLPADIAPNGSEQANGQVAATVTNGSEVLISTRPHGSVQLDVEARVLDPTVTVKKERIESVGDNCQTLLNSGDIRPNELAGRDIAPVVTHGSARLSVEARVRQLEKMIDSLE